MGFWLCSYVKKLLFMVYHHIVSEILFLGGHKQALPLSHSVKNEAHDFENMLEIMCFIDSCMKKKLCLVDNNIAI